LARNRPHGTPNCGHEAMNAIVIGARPFHREQYGAAPFSAHADALDEAQDGEKDGAPNADAFVCGHQGDRESGKAHEHQGRNQGGLAPDAIAVMAENCSSHGPRHEADRVDAERLKGSDQRVGVRKEEFRENEAGHRAIEKEVVPFDRGADGGGNDRAPELDVMLVRRQRGRSEMGGSHGVLPRVRSFAR
jgi:hypothetical protein